MNLPEIAREMIHVRREIDEALERYRDAILEDADADRAARVAKASAYLASSGTVGERAAAVDQTTADVVHRARVAEGMKRAAASAVENKRQELSSLQSLANLTRAEANLATYEPAETA